MQVVVWIEPNKYCTWSGKARMWRGVLQGVVRMDPVCIEGRVCKGRQGCSETKQLGQGEAGEARMDGISR